MTPALVAPTAKTVAPEETRPTTPAPAAQANTDSANVGGTTAVDDSKVDDVPLPVQSDKLVLPRTAYGTETEGTLAKRLLATVEGNRIYQPSFAGKNVVFTTADDTNVYAWRVDLTNPSEPQLAAMTEWAALPNPDEALQSAAPQVEATTLVTSPDKTMIAQNSADGLWISLLDGDVFRLTQEGNGKLLAWSPDSAKVVFTNADGALFVGYPFEQRIYQLADGGVKDVCWHSNNKTLLYVADDGDNDALYIVETY